jgi:hypothetical protein
MTTLWELSDDLLTLENLILDIQEDEEIKEDERETKIKELFEQWLNSSANFDEKALKVASYIRHQEALAEARQQEYRRLRALAEQAQNQADRLRGYLAKEMTRTGKAKIEGAIAKLSLRKKPPRVCLNCDVDKLPDQFKKIEVSPRLTEIKKAIQSDPSIEWAFLSESTEHSLTIR